MRTETRCHEMRYGKEEGSKRRNSGIKLRWKIRGGAQAVEIAGEGAE